MLSLIPFAAGPANFNFKEGAGSDKNILASLAILSPIFFGGDT